MLDICLDLGKSNVFIIENSKICVSSKHEHWNTHKMPTEQY